MNKEHTDIPGVEELKELLYQFNLIVGDIDIDYDENMANVYIEISPTGIYTIEGIESAIKKIKELKKTLIEDGLIDDMMLGDLYKGSWKILIYFT